MHSETFHVDLNNIPLIDLRNEFNTYHALFKKEDFRAQFASAFWPIKTPFMTWYGGPPEAFLTLLLQRAVTGIEAYLPGAVFVEMGRSGALSSENVKPVKNPWLLGGRSVTENYYHRLPSLLRDDASLKRCNNGLWEANKKFYTEIRNPLFHGLQLSRVDMGGFSLLLEHVALLYDWIDIWHSPENLFRGCNALSRTRRSADI